MTREPRVLIGGQAVIEGVMMRSPRWTSTVVRRPDGGIVAFTEQRISPLLQFRWLRLPVARGIGALYDALSLGIRALLISANAAQGEDVPLTRRQVAATVTSGLAMAVGLFFLLPAAVIRLWDRSFGNVYTLNVAEGLLRIGLLIGYVAGIGRFPDIARLFAYHGAEHKAVNAYEAGAPLQVDAARGYSRFHPRCGTSFLLIVMIVAIVVFSVLGRPALWVRLASRLVFIPLVAGISYEIIRAGARTAWLHPLVLPGVWLQRLTTRDPDDRQLEVAVRALREVVEHEDALKAGSVSSGL